MVYYIYELELGRVYYIYELESRKVYYIYGLELSMVYYIYVLELSMDYYIYGLETMYSRSPRLPKWDGSSREPEESITIYRAEDSGPDFSDDEIEYKDVKVMNFPFSFLNFCCQ